MIPEEEKENDRDTNCLCHSSKTIHTEKKGKTPKSADDPIIRK
jgi:hypothetical protein